VSFNAAMLKQMQEEGLDLSACIRVLEAAERKADPTNAQRQARHRAKRKAKAESNAVTVTPVTPPNDIDILTPQTSTPIVISSEITPPADDQKTELQPEHVVEVWNDLAAKHGLPAVKKITPERRKKLRSFIRRHTIDDITEAISAIPRSPFLLGQNQRGWQASFDWFLEPRNLTKLTEGTYVH
jgi:hypothetical protein